MMAPRRGPPPKAWTSGTNPLTQKNAAPAQQNGTVSQQKPSGPARPPLQKEQPFTDRHANDRFRFIITAATVQVPFFS